MFVANSAVCRAGHILDGRKHNPSKTKQRCCVKPPSPHVLLYHWLGDGKWQAGTLLAQARHVTLASSKAKTGYATLPLALCPHMAAP